VFRATDPLPAGLTLNGRFLTGTPSEAGTFQVPLEVSDSQTPPAQASTVYEVRVLPLLRIAGPVTLVEGYPNKAYSEKVYATGGVPPYTFRFMSGSLPPGLTLLQDGSVAGTPSGNKIYNFEVEVTDSDPQRPQTALRLLTLKITSAPLLLTISTQSMPDGRVGTPYQYVLRSSSSANITWTLKDGSLPPGVSFFVGTGTISGTPTVKDTYSFTINVTDGLLGNTNKSFTLEVK
jgi:hypothetical protein